jgi:hypothetical protein
MIGCLRPINRDSLSGMRFALMQIGAFSLPVGRDELLKICIKEGL